MGLWWLMTPQVRKMKIFQCHKCSNQLHFNNDVCLKCGYRVGYDPQLFDMVSLVPDDDIWLPSTKTGKSYYLCQNAEQAACNWLVDAENGLDYCMACRFNLTIPDLSQAGNLDRWQRIEQAKKHLIYSLTRLGLPLPNRIDDPDRGLAFEFLADVANVDGSIEKVLTGHSDGLISLNIAEADDAERERRRASMGEPYRTLVGHFRHEIGHFYWDLLVRNQGKIAEFREVFGDPDQNYGEALHHHYTNGAPPDWQQYFISAYASSHPWEDFAETWAHCMHMTDGLETAQCLGLAFGGTGSDSVDTTTLSDPYHAENARDLIAAWIPLTVAINSMNRSLGQPDLYPFVLSGEVMAKIDFIIRLMATARHSNSH
jgi:hypothetical protein